MTSFDTYDKSTLDTKFAGKVSSFDVVTSITGSETGDAAAKVPTVGAVNDRFLSRRPRQRRVPHLRQCCRHHFN